MGSTIIEAARALLDRCDGAATKDEKGYNGADSGFVHGLFERRWLTGGQLGALARLLPKYKAQLAVLGFDVPQLTIPPPGPTTSQTGAAGTPSAGGIHLGRLGDNDPAINRFERGTGRRDADGQWLSKASAGARMVVTKEILGPAKTESFVEADPLAPEPWSPPGQILDHFPPGFTPRPQQLKAIAEIDAAYRAGKRVAVLEMPTGGGKSFICQTFARATREGGGDTHFLTIQKALQGQYQRDFPSPELETVKGRANFPCSQRAGSDCAHAPCTERKKGILPECVLGGGEDVGKAVALQLPPSHQLCPYWRQLQVAHDSPITLFNFSSFLFQQRLGRFGHRSLMIVDEGHNIEGQLANYVTLELTEWALRIIDVTIDRQITTKAQLVDWLREKEILGRIAAALESDGEGGGRGEDLAAELDKAQHDALLELQDKIGNFLAYLDKTEWLLETVDYKGKNDDDRRKITARPLYVKDFAEDLLFRHADRILVMSATILDVGLWARNLGLKMADVAHIQTPCDFPVENRTVHLTYAGNCGFKHFSPTQNPGSPTEPKWLAMVEAILRRHEGQRGIIHCHSFALSTLLRDRIASPRFVFQENYRDKEEMLADHAARPASVIVAPAMAEGFDLKNDLSRFQIIAKVPWPSMTDKLIAERMARHDGYFEWLTALKIVQGYGRSVRSADDWAFTYIIDSGFDGFLSRNRRLIPAWMQAAFRKYAPTNVRREAVAP